MTFLFLSFSFFFLLLTLKKKAWNIHPSCYFSIQHLILIFFFFLSSFLRCFPANRSSYLPIPWRYQRRKYRRYARTMAKRKQRVFWTISSWKANKRDICISWGNWKASVKSLQSPSTMTHEIYLLPFGDPSILQSLSLSAF